MMIVRIAVTKAPFSLREEADAMENRRYLSVLIPLKNPVNRI